MTLEHHQKWKVIRMIVNQVVLRRKQSNTKGRVIRKVKKKSKVVKEKAKVKEKKAKVKEDKSKVVAKAKAKRKIDSTESVSAAKKTKVDKSVKRKRGHEDSESEKSSELSHKHRKDNATKVEPSKVVTLTEPLEVDIDNLCTVSTAKCVSVDIDQFNSLIDFVRYVK